MTIIEEEVWTKADLVDLAKRQKQVRFMLLLLVAVSAQPFLLPASLVDPLIRIESVPLIIVLVYFAYKLVVAVLPPSESSAIPVYVVLSALPLINFVALLYLDRQATKRLRACGVKVGLVGAMQTDLDALKDDFTYRYSPTVM